MYCKCGKTVHPVRLDLGYTRRVLTVQPRKLTHTFQS